MNEKITREIGKSFKANENGKTILLIYGKQWEPC